MHVAVQDQPEAGDGQLLQEAVVAQAGVFAAVERVVKRRDPQLAGGRCR
jgi:hypothetical protein